MKKATAKRWAIALKVSENEFNDYLEKINYQVKDIDDSLNEIWILTQNGKKHGRKSYNPFNNSLLWDIDAFFEVMKVRGKITRKYFYCDECGAFLSRQSGFEREMYNWVCKRCGHINKLYYVPEDYQIQRKEV